MANCPEDTWWSEDMGAYVGYETNELYYDSEGTDPMHSSEGDDY